MGNEVNTRPTDMQLGLFNPISLRTFLVSDLLSEEPSVGPVLTRLSRTVIMSHPAERRDKGKT